MNFAAVQWLLNSNVRTRGRVNALHNWRVFFDILAAEFNDMPLEAKLDTLAVFDSVVPLHTIASAYAEHCYWNSRDDIAAAVWVTIKYYADHDFQPAIDALRRKLQDDLQHPKLKD